MDSTSILGRLAEILQSSPEAMTEQTPLTNENWDSVAMLGTIALVDAEFGRTVPTNELKDCSSVGDILRLIERTLAE